MLYKIHKKIEIVGKEAMEKQKRQNGSKTIASGSCSEMQIFERSQRFQ